MRVLFTASRGWYWVDPIQYALERALKEYGNRWAFSHENTLVAGAARGGDAIALSLAARMGWTLQPYPVTNDQWRASRGAGMARNAEMVRDGADICLAFIKNESRGASHCLDLARRSGIPCWVYRLPVYIPPRRTARDS